MQVSGYLEVSFRFSFGYDFGVGSIFVRYGVVWSSVGSILFRFGVGFRWKL